LQRGLPQTEIKFMGDRHLVGQCLVNLLENSIKFAAGANRIEVSLSSLVTNSFNEVRITIADNGSGIAETARDKVKQRFFRVDKSRNSEGSGLGLSLVDAVVKLHHGELLLEDNKPGLKVILIFRVSA
jgi:signal transduction histidine kinase